MSRTKKRKIVQAPIIKEGDNFDFSNCACLDLTTEKLLMIHDAVGKEYGHQMVIDNTIAAAYILLRVENVTLVMIKRDEEGKLMTSDSFEPGIDCSRGVAAVVAATGRTLRSNMTNEYGDFVTFPGERKEAQLNVLCAAARSNCGEIIGVITVLNKSDATGAICPFHKDDEAILESITSNMAVAITKVAVYEQEIREKRRYCALIPVIRARSSSEPLVIILREIVQVVCQLLFCDSVAIFLVDDDSREAVICASNSQLDGYTVAFGQGTAGKAAANNKPIRITDADKYARINSEADNFCGIVTTSILCAPIPAFKIKAAPAAIIQAINRRDKCNFDRFDEESLVLICEEISNILRSKAIELQELRSLTSDLNRNDLTDSTLQHSLLSEYGSKHLKLQAHSPSMSRTTSMTSFFNRSDPSRCKRIYFLDAAPVDMMTQEEVEEYLFCHDTDPFELDDMTLIYLSKHMLDAYGLVERFELNLDKLRIFFITVHNNYHKNNSFHNYKHAWATMHLTFQILKKGADQYLTSLDIMALLIAAVCHDLDHPGNNNAFEVATRSALAVTYSDDTVLERHHCSTALKLLDEHDFMPGMMTNDKARLRKIITASIMATDMSQHFSLVDQLTSHGMREKPFRKKDSEERIILARLVLHAADIGAQTQSRKLALKWTQRCLDEFSSQGTKEKLLGLELTPFMQGLDDELTRMQLQVGFVGGIVIPLWSSLSACFPELDHAVNQAISTKTYYADQMAAIIEKRCTMR